QSEMHIYATAARSRQFWKVESRPSESACGVAARPDGCSGNAQEWRRERNRRAGVRPVVTGVLDMHEDDGPSGSACWGGVRSDGCSGNAQEWRRERNRSAGVGLVVTAVLDMREGDHPSG